MHLPAKLWVPSQLICSVVVSKVIQAYYNKLSNSPTIVCYLAIAAGSCCLGIAHIYHEDLVIYCKCCYCCFFFFLLLVFAFTHGKPQMQFSMWLSKGVGLMVANMTHFRLFSRNFCVRISVRLSHLLKLLFNCI